MQKFNYISKRGVLLVSTPLLLYSADTLDTILVIENDSASSYKQSKSTSSKTYIDEKMIDSFPKGNGNINEVLKYLPNIQNESSNAASSSNAGELEPENISISGGAFYQNNFQIDGISNNSLLDPASTHVYKNNLQNDVKGHPQEIFIDTDMIKSITVYDSDVPAKFGRFTGGVVDTITKHALADFGGKIKYRYTSDKYTKFFISDKDDFEKSKDGSKMQPKFKKSFYGFSLNTPRDEDSGVYTNISIKESIIPLMHFKGSKSETRKSDNYLIKYSTYLKNDDILDVTMAYSPYEEHRFMADVKDSDYTIKGGGLKTYLNHERETDTYKIKTAIAHSRTINKKDAPSNYFKWGSSDTMPWGGLIGKGITTVGGFGNIEKTQVISTIKSDIEFKNKFDIGFEIQQGDATFQRKDDGSSYRVALGNGKATNNGILNLVCMNQDGCIDGEQYANTKDTYHTFKADVGVYTQAAYIQKKINIDKFSTRLGLRYDYNNYTENHDLAYRNTNKYDIFGDKNSIVSIGFNKYYANSFLTYKLRAAKKPYITYTRALEGKIDSNGNQYVTPGDWEENSRRGTSKTRSSELKTPYSDEKTISLTQNIYDGKFIIKYINRDKKDAFSRTWGEVESDGYRYYSLSNDGYRKYKSISLSYEKKIENHFFRFSTTDSKTKKSNLDYDDDIDTSIARIYYNYSTSKQDEIHKNDLPLSQETDPKIIKLLYSYDYKDMYIISGFIKHTTKYKKIEKVEKKEYEYYNVQQDRNDWTDTGVYELIHRKAKTIVDLSLECKYKIKNNEKVIFKTDIKNLFNTKTKVYSDKNKYALGRQIWFEVAYKF